MRRISLLLLIIPTLLLGAACSDDDAASAPQATATQAGTSEVLGSRDPGALQGTIAVDFTGAPEELDAINAAFEVPAGSTAWDAIKDALGEDNVSTQDFGGGMGIFITGFNGVEVQGNHFWEFRVNGESSQVGVSQYEVQPGDVLEFVYSSF